jgi:hypothetical protein
MIRWEYRVITVNTEYEVPIDGKITDSAEGGVIVERHLNASGKDGWELVSRGAQLRSGSREQCACDPKSAVSLGCVGRGLARPRRLR